VTRDVWAEGGAYEAYVGRWSRLVAGIFLDWLDRPAGQRWLDVGCGTGALSSAVLTVAEPARVTGVDRSVPFLGDARARTADPRAAFAAGDARALPVASAAFDTVVSGLALNFVPDHRLAAGELARAAAPGGVVAAYVWDYAGGMQMMRYFWDAAAELDPAVAERDEARRFPICHPQPLAELWAASGLREVATRPVEIPTVFADFDDYWQPFLGGQGAAPAYAMSLTAERRDALRELLRARVPAGADGGIALTATAWAVRGTRPPSDTHGSGREGP
jgi:SAM-dependent methyltransferase